MAVNILERPDFYDDALCKHVEGALSLYFPTIANPNTAAIAKQICAECSVREECFDYSIELAQQVDVHGVWGGMSQRERQNYMRKNKISTHRVPYDPKVLE